MMFRREMRRDQRRDIVEVAAVSGMVHEGRKEHEEEAEVANHAAQRAQQTQRPRRIRAADEQMSKLQRPAKLKGAGLLILADAEASAEKGKILGRSTHPRRAWVWLGYRLGCRDESATSTCAWELEFSPTRSGDELLGLRLTLGAGSC